MDKNTKNSGIETKENVDLDQNAARNKEKKDSSTVKDDIKQDDLYSNEKKVEDSNKNDLPKRESCKDLKEVKVEKEEAIQNEQEVENEDNEEGNDADNTTEFKGANDEKNEKSNLGEHYQDIQKSNEIHLNKECEEKSNSQLDFPNFTVAANEKQSYLGESQLFEEIVQPKNSFRINISDELNTIQIKSILHKSESKKKDNKTLTKSTKAEEISIYPVNKKHASNNLIQSVEIPQTKSSLTASMNLNFDATSKIKGKVQSLYDELYINRKGNIYPSSKKSNIHHNRELTKTKDISIISSSKPFKSKERIYDIAPDFFGIKKETTHVDNALFDRFTGKLKTTSEEIKSILKSSNGSGSFKKDKKIRKPDVSKFETSGGKISDNMDNRSYLESLRKNLDEYSKRKNEYAQQRNDSMKSLDKRLEELLNKANFIKSNPEEEGNYEKDNQIFTKNDNFEERNEDNIQYNEDKFEMVEDKNNNETKTENPENKDLNSMNDNIEREKSNENKNKNQTKTENQRYTEELDNNGSETPNTKAEESKQKTNES